MRYFSREHKLNIFLLQETKVKVNKIQQVKKKVWNKAHLESIESINRSGLWIIWNPKIA